MRKRSVLDRQILPTLGNYPVGAMKPSVVAAAVATWSQRLAPGTVGQVLRQVRQILDATLADGLVASNAAKSVKAPSAPRRRDVHLTDDDVTAGLVFTSTTGRPLTKSIARHVFDDIERTVGFTLSPHSLRHYFGASLISRGVSVVAVARWLGHSSPEITYRVYAYLKPNDEDAGRTAIAQTMSQVVPDVYPLCTKEASE